MEALEAVGMVILMPVIMDMLLEGVGVEVRLGYLSWEMTSPLLEAGAVE
jgi:hypothetical protein